MVNGDLWHRTLTETMNQINGERFAGCPFQIFHKPKGINLNCGHFYRGNEDSLTSFHQA